MAWQGMKHKTVFYNDTDGNEYHHLLWGRLCGVHTYIYVVSSVCGARSWPLTLSGILYCTVVVYSVWAFDDARRAFHGGIPSI